MSFPSFPPASSSTSASDSTALPWDLQRSLNALLAGRSTLELDSSSSPQSSTTIDEADEAREREQAFHRPYGTYREGFGGMMRLAGQEEGGEGARTPFGGRATLQVPFFRWFGPTAYTPGLRRVKVELRSEPPEDPSPDDPQPNTLPGLSPSQGSLQGQASTTSFSPPTSDQPLQGRTDLAASSPATSGSHPSPGDSKNVDSPGRTAEETKKSHRSALFKKGRDKAYPIDEIFEELLVVFWKNLAAHFPFLSKRRILEQHRARTLPALLANSICALASRFSNHPLLLPLRSSPTSYFESAIPFEDQAKQLLIPLLSFPTEETCTALVLLSYNEFGGGRDSGLFMYTGMAIRVVQDLGMQHEISLVPHGGEEAIGANQKEQIARRRLLFWAVFLLDRTISYGTGRKATIHEAEIDIVLPTVEDCDLLSPPEPGAPRAPNPWPALIYMTRHRGMISDSLNAPGGNTDQKSRERIERLQGNMINFYSSMHPVLHFSVQSFKLYRDLDLTPSFLFLHLMFHSVITVLHRPSLLQNFSHGGQVLLEPNVEVSRSSARTMSNMLSYAETADPRAIISNPFADQLIFISAMAFLDERVALELSKRIDSMGLGMSSSSTADHGFGSGGDGTKTPNGTRLLRSFADSKLDISLSALKAITSRWAGVGWVIRTIDQKKRGFTMEDVDPDTDAEVPIVLFPRDPAMIKAWLAREWTNGKDQKMDSPSWDGGMWDENMLAMVPPDVGLSFTGQGLEDPSHHLTMSLDAPPSAEPWMFPTGADPNVPNPLELPYPMDNLPPDFFENVLWAGGAP